MTVIPYPIPETLVVVPVYDGVAQTELLHAPAPFIRIAQEGRAARKVTIGDRTRNNNGIPPYEWPSVCGVVGVVYVNGGVLEGKPMCGSCSGETLDIPDIEILHGTRHGYVNRKCRCSDCRRANADYRREHRRKVA